MQVRNNECTHKKKVLKGKIKFGIDFFAKFLSESKRASYELCRLNKKDLPPIVLLVSLLSVVWDDGCCCRPFRSWSISWLSFSVRQTKHNRKEIIQTWNSVSFLYSKNRIINKSHPIHPPFSCRVQSVSKCYASFPQHIYHSAELVIDMQIVSLVFDDDAE